MTILNITVFGITCHCNNLLIFYWVAINSANGYTLQGKRAFIHLQGKRIIKKNCLKIPYKIRKTIDFLLKAIKNF